MSETLSEKIAKALVDRGCVSILWPHAVHAPLDKVVSAVLAVASRSLEWQSIDTAPKDGTRVLLFPHYVVAHWEFGDDEWMLTEVPLEPDGRIAVDWTVPPKRWYCLYANVGGHEPTHWMPLPCALAQQPPSGETAK